ncbi:phosphoesterase [Microbacterium phage Fransoyer]|nr:phosphoesterase [Microbacterium phage Fransoyer]
MPAFGAPSYGGGAAAPLVIPRPAGLVDNGYVALAARSQDASGSTPWTPPAGFQLVSAAFVLPSSSYRVGAVWVKHIGLVADEPASYTLTGPTGRCVGIAAAYFPDEAGALATVGAAPYGGSSVANGIVNFGARTNSAAPAVTLVALGAECVAGVSMVPSQIPAGFTAIGNAQSSLDSSTTGSRTALWLGYRVEPTTAVDTFSGGYASGSGAAGYSGSVRGGAVAPPTPIGLPVKLGTGAPAYLSYLDGAGVRRAPASIRVQRPEFLVADMLETPGVTMGHRGASLTPGMPEMSRRAYRYDVSTRNFPVLEFSCGRTSDNVFFGLHDADLNRTSQTTGLPAVSTMTWAQVQQYLNSLNANGTPVPYYRLEDFIDEFGQEAALHIDPKWAVGVGNAAFLNVLKAHGGPEKIVVKFVGTGSGATGLATAARNEGFTTAGYFYATDWASGAIDAEQSFWDILGMEYDASADVWARTTTGAYPGLRSYGKPVLAHIIPSQAAYNTAKAKIEEGGWVDPAAGRSWIAQISRPDLVAPVR